jgi:hypothetical protein
VALVLMRPKSDTPARRDHHLPTTIQAVVDDIRIVPLSTVRHRRGL